MSAFAGGRNCTLNRLLLLFTREKPHCGACRPLLIGKTGQNVLSIGIADAAFVVGLLAMGTQLLKSIGSLYPIIALTIPVMFLGISSLCVMLEQEQKVDATTANGRQTLQYGWFRSWGNRKPSKNYPKSTRIFP